MKYYITLFLLSFTVLLFMQASGVDAAVQDSTLSGAQQEISQGREISVSENDSSRCTTTMYDHLIGKDLQPLRKVVCEPK